MKKDDMRLYAVTDSSHLNGRALEACVDDALAGGATFVQLREKNLSTAELALLGAKIKRVTDKYGVPFVINDDAEAALMCGADGVHVGQSDMAAEKARKALGEGKIVGVSAHSVSEAIAAQNSGADYIGVGAMFHTSTKTNASVLSPEALREICAAVSIPVVIIGGLKRDNIHLFKGCGAQGAAVVSALFSQNDIKAAARELRKVCDAAFEY